MRSSSILVPLLAPFAAAFADPTPAPAAAPSSPAANIVPRAKPLAPDAPWVSVNKKGTPTTITPVLTTVSGTPTYESGAPNALTGTVFTFTNRRDALVSVSTGDPPIATAKAKNGKGAFVPCHNIDMEHAPFCAPEKDGELFVGKTYYVTWDATAPVLKSNTSEKVWIHLVGYYVNSTTGEIDDTEDPIFNPNKKHVKPAKHGFYPWHVGGNTIPRGEQNATIQLRIQRHIDDEYVGPDVVGQTVFVRRQDRPPHRDTRPPGDKELYIALPIVGAGLLFILGGLFWYNRQSRRVGLGNVSSRSGFEKRKSRAAKLLAKMHGGSGSGKASGSGGRGRNRGENAFDGENMELMGGHDRDSSPDSDGGWDAKRFAGGSGTRFMDDRKQRKRA
ncbi:hypothetical protein VD0004_g1461 [Verticillium dahliae]|uniref:Uncharacterized protein n=1 Tax=Verticillium dahliae TaxID=27337 RepID=A0A444S811_VERDA|nr:hypothetical protein VD0004_g1461 [Verticillium dahliae]PNH75783.1 hypothetical protein VD0001_g1757 [Verticillium dahliae]RXG49523.1 hypothetical protein VDGE_06831 [Verticillium dahliae]